MFRQYISAALLVVASNASPITSTDVSVNANNIMGSPDEFGADFNETAWQEKLVAAGVSLVTPEIDYDWLNYTAPAEHLEHAARAKRQDCHNTALVVDKTETFTDWDVQMSPVVCAVGPMTISVADGYSVSNSMSVSAGLDFNFIKDKLGGSLGIDFSRTWTTTATITVGGTVPDGNCGVMIWKPTTTRRYGSVMEGCIGDLKKTGTFVANDRGSGQYAGVQWIAGARSLCVKPGNNPPLSLCQGSGNFI